MKHGVTSRPFQRLRRTTIADYVKLTIGEEVCRRERGSSQNGNKNTKREFRIITNRSSPIAIQVTLALPATAIQASSICPHGIQRRRDFSHRLRGFMSGDRHILGDGVHQIPHSWSNGDTGIGGRPVRRQRWCNVVVLARRHCCD